MKLKRSRVFMAGAAALGVTLLGSLPAAADVGVTVNGSAVDLSPPPIVQAGRVFVPLRGVFEQLGASVVYANGTINATGNGRDISLQIGSTQATVNDQPQTIDVAPFIVGATTYVPLRFISEALGDSVSWNDADSIAAIDTGGGSADYFTPGTASYVDTAPPPIPSYAQPYVPASNYIWQPGYWAWGSYGYYWVPGTWVQAPQAGYLWTPGYWQWNNGGFNWNPGYWARAVGFYGGVNYGGGYYGRGYDGGRWTNGAFRYNAYVTNVNRAIVRNVYVDRTVYVDKSSARPSYNGGRGGLEVRPDENQLAVARLHHLGMTAAQREHLRAAEQDRRLVATVNHERPPVLAVARPLSKSTRPTGFVPVKPVERVDPQAHVAPVHVAPVHVAPVQAAPLHAAPAERAKPASVAPVAHVPPVHPLPAVVTSEARAPVQGAPVQRAPVQHLPVYHATAAHAAAVYAAPVPQAVRTRTAPVDDVPGRTAPAARPPQVREVPPPAEPAVRQTRPRTSDTNGKPPR